MIDKTDLWKLNQYNSSLIIYGGSLRENETYQISVNIINRLNSLVQGIGYLIVNVKDNSGPIIIIG